MNQVIAAMDAAWRVLTVGLVLGAGLPALFALGVRSLAWGSGGDAEAHAEGILPAPHILGRVVAYALFSVVVAAISLGIGYIIAHGLGMTITFDGLIPVFTPKA